MSALGRAAGVRTPAIDALVETVRNMTGKDFAADARTLEHLGPSGMSAARNSGLSALQRGLASAALGPCSTKISTKSNRP